jgi:hypothetical protein
MSNMVQITQLMKLNLRSQSIAREIGADGIYQQLRQTFQSLDDMLSVEFDLWEEKVRTEVAETRRLLEDDNGES